MSSTHFVSLLIAHAQPTHSHTRTHTREIFSIPKDALRYSNILGLDVYTKVRGDDKTGVSRCSVLPKHYKKLAQSKGRQAWITELQAEPWNPSSFTTADLDEIYEKVVSLKFDTVLLWGFEKWLDNKVNRREMKMWDAVSEKTKLFLKLK